MDTRFFTRFNNLGFICIFFTDTDIFFESIVEHLYILHNNADSVQKFVVRNIPYIFPAQPDTSFIYLIKTQQ